VKAGGPDDRRELARMVRFPRPESDENTIRVEGTQAVVDKIVAAMEELVSGRDSQITDTLEVAPEKHRLLIGRGGETRRNLESQFNVSIDIPRQTATGAARSQVKLSGQPSDIESAKTHILSLVKDQEGETIAVPRSLHHAIADNGQFFRRLRNDHRVTVDHNGQAPPPKPATPQPRREKMGANGEMPLITDDGANGSVDAHFWDLHALHNDTGDAGGEIPWVLRGNADNIAKARASLESAMANAKKQTHVGFLILPDPRSYRLIVGPGGGTINGIRRTTGTRINVPRDQGAGEAVEILGSEDGVVGARDSILEIVREGEKSRGGGRRN
jgi:rRNA processing protein Krr1/Pno1